MTNNKQQTAVEWFAEKSWKLKVQLENEKISVGEYSVSYVRLLNKAKEMEKEKIIDAWSNGFDEDDRATSNPLKYYEQTYGGGEQ
jgi:superfamily I DNA and/or RNA helicase